MWWQCSDSLTKYFKQIPILAKPLMVFLFSQELVYYALSNNFCPERPGCQHTSWIRIAAPINRTIMIMNRCQTHLRWPTFHPWHQSDHYHGGAKASHSFLSCLVCSRYLCSKYSNPDTLRRCLKRWNCYVVSLWCWMPQPFSDLFALHLGHVELHDVCCGLEAEAGPSQFQ